jgi:hypothetical protein
MAASRAAPIAQMQILTDNSIDGVLASELPRHSMSAIQHN